MLEGESLVLVPVETFERSPMREFDPDGFDSHGYHRWNRKEMGMAGIASGYYHPKKRRMNKDEG